MSKVVFENLVKLKPSKHTAIIFNDGTDEIIVSYEVFLTKSQSLRKELEFLCGGSNEVKTLIGISSRPSVDLPVLLYSIIQARFVFIPISTEISSLQLIRSIRQCKFKWIVVPYKQVKCLTGMIEENISVKKVYTLKCLPEYAMIELNIDCLVLQKELVYIIQSSGTTGDPKIIHVTQKCIIPNVLDLMSLFSIKSTDVILLSSAITFDASLLQMFLSWSSNATLLVTTKDIVYSPKIFVKVLRMITILQCTPSLLHLVGTKLLKKYIFTDKSKLRVVALGGESFLSRSQFIDWTINGRHIQYYNIYGTSEVSSWASVYHVTNTNLPSGSLTGDSDWVPIGNMLSDTIVEVRNKNNDVISSGYGEIFIGGKNRICYLSNETSLTAQTMRSTGDIGFVDNNKLIYLCGRKDNQINRNGQLISLVALTNIINDIDLVENFSCIFDKQEKLYVFIQTSAYTEQDIIRQTEKELLEKIQINLPRSYLPDHILFVESIPITPHGKVDTCKLLKTETETNHVLLEDMEEFIAHSWNIALNTTSSSDETFSECGGDSFSAVFFLNKILRCFQLVDVSYEYLFSKILTSNLTQVQSLLCSANKNTVNVQSKVSSNVNTGFSPALLNTNQSQISYCNHFIAYHKQFFKSQCSCKTVIVTEIQKSNIKKSCITISQKWRYNLGKCVDASPIVVFSDDHSYGIVYVGCHSHIFASISFDNGQKVWDLVLNDRIESTATITEDGNDIIFGSYDGSIYFINSKTGEINWKYSTGDIVKSSPTVYKNIVIIGCHDKYIYALCIKSKQLLWKYYVNSSCCSSPLVNPSQNCVYITLLSGRMISMDLTSGTLLWGVNVKNPIFTSPCLCRDFVAFSCVDEKLYAVDFEGNHKWNFQTSAPIFSSPVCIESADNKSQFIVFGSNDHFLYCLDNQGVLVWKHKAQSEIVASVAVYHGVFDVQSVFRSAAHRKRRHEDIFETTRSKTGDNDDQHLTCINDTFIIYIDTKGHIGLLDLYSGDFIAAFECKGEVFSSPVVANDCIIVGCRDDHVYCLQIQSK